MRVSLNLFTIAKKSIVGLHDADSVATGSQIRELYLYDSNYLRCLADPV